MTLFLLSISASAILIGVLLLLTRQRLTRQFDNIERRQLEIERTVAAIKLGIERSTTDAQLERLHLGQVRMQENIARRYGPLLQATEYRQVGEFLSASLQQWSRRFGLGFDAGRIEELARTVARAERQQGSDLPIATPDLLAAIIALLGSGRRRIAVGVLGVSAEPFAEFLPCVIAEAFEEMTVSEVPENSSSMSRLDALVFDDAVPLGKWPAAFGLVNEGGLLIVHTDSEGRDESGLEGFEPVAAEWRTRVYRKCAP